MLHGAFSPSRASVGGMPCCLLSAALLTSCFKHISAAVEFVPVYFFQEDSVDVKALRARFNTKPITSPDTSSRDSGSPKSPQPGFGRLPLTESNLAHHRLSPTVPPPPLASSGQVRFPRPAESMAASRPPLPRPSPSPGVRAPLQPADHSRVKLKEEMLQNMMLRHQRPPIPKQAPAHTTPPPLRQQPRKRSAGEVTPLRRPLPPEGPLPRKPKRPPNVNLEPFLRLNRGPALPGPKKSDGKSRAYFSQFLNHARLN